MAVHAAHAAPVPVHRPRGHRPHHQGQGEEQAVASREPPPGGLDRGHPRGGTLEHRPPAGLMTPRSTHPRGGRRELSLGRPSHADSWIESTGNNPVQSKVFIMTDTIEWERTAPSTQTEAPSIEGVLRAARAAGSGAIYHLHDQEVDHTTQILQAIVGEVESFGRQPRPTSESQYHFNETLCDIQLLPIPQEDVAALDNVLFARTLEVLEDDSASALYKDAWVSVSLCIGLDGRRITRAQKKMRLHEAQRTNPRAVDYYVRSIMSEEEASNFLKAARLEHKRASVSRLISASVIGTLALTYLFNGPLDDSNLPEPLATMLDLREIMEESAPIAALADVLTHTEPPVEQTTTPAEAPAQLPPEAQAIQDMIERAETDAEKRKYTAFHYLLSQGFTPEQTAGIIGNLMVESASTMDPAIHQIGGGPGRGIAQWGGWAKDEHGNKVYDANGNRAVAGRFTNLQAFAESQGKPWDDLSLQLDFIMHEFNTTHKKALTKVKESATVRDAAFAFMKWYEGPRDQDEAALMKRVNPGQASIDVYYQNVERVTAERAEYEANKAACETIGTTYLGKADGWDRGEQHTIHLCELPAAYWYNPEIPMRLNVQFAPAVMTILQKAHEAGDDLRLVDSYRTSEQQHNGRVRNGCPDDTSAPSTCRIPTAPVNYSNHQMGMAVDFADTGKKSARFELIQKIVTEHNVPIKNYHKEAWHWSVDGR